MLTKVTVTVNALGADIAWKAETNKKEKEKRGDIKVESRNAKN